MTNDPAGDVETRIKIAIVQLLSGDIPDGLKCDVKSLCALASVPRATLYRTYPHLKAEFDARRQADQDTGRQPDPREARIDRLRAEINTLHERLTNRDHEITELKTFRRTALSRLSAQHEEILALRAQTTAFHDTIRPIPIRRPGR